MKILQVEKNELRKLASVFNRQIGRFVLFIFLLFFDSIYFSENVTSSQITVNIIMIGGFIRMFLRCPPRIKESMIYAVLIGIVGEYFFSLGMEMYTYRLENVPIYVPLGHGVLFCRVLLFSKTSIVKRNSASLEQIFSIVIALLSLFYLVFLNDVFGFVMTILVFLMMLKRPNDRLFFYTMYLMVAALEIGGTAFGCWKWPNTAFGVFPLLPSNNPPSGISLFYFLLDVSCFFVYKTVNHKTWTRFKRINRKG